MAEQPAPLPPLPWTGLQQLTSPDSIVTFQDFAYITRCFKWKTSFGARRQHYRYWPQGLPTKIEAHVAELHWSQQTKNTTGRACHKAIGRVLASAMNGMVKEGGQGEDLGSAQLSMRADIEGCLRLDSSKLPADWKVTVSHAGAGYPQLILGKWSYTDSQDKEAQSTQVTTMGGHRLMCWLVHGDPPTAADECMHQCRYKGRPWCCNPRHLVWGTHELNNASPRRWRKRRR